MKLVAISLVVFTTVFACMAVPAVGQTPTTFTGNHNNDWNDGRNWSAGVPGPTSNAIIPVGKTPFIGQNDSGVCQIITLSGTLRLKKDSVLTIGQQDLPNSSTISGTMTIGKQDDPNHGPATLKISGDHTITGDDGTIELVRESVIDDNGDEDDLLTIKCDSEADCSKDDRPLIEDSLVITGVGSIKVALQNEAYVVAGPPGVLVLADHDKDSNCCGSWIAEEGGELGVQCLVEGTGTWRAQDDDYEDDDYLGGTITIGYDGTAGCVLSDGPVYVNGFDAVLGVTATGYFCTDGNLRFQSVLYDEDQKTNPMIWVAPDGGAEFGVCNDVQCPE